jgi:hypothetical protein
MVLALHTTVMGIQVKQRTELYIFRYVETSSRPLPLAAELPQTFSTQRQALHSHVSLAK